MPVHVFLSQSLSLLTGGLEVWKAAKDVIVTLLVVPFLSIAYRRRLFSGEYKWHFMLGTIYVLLHLLFVILSSHDDTYSAIVGAVYNNRLLAFLLLGLLIGSSSKGKEYLQKLSVAVVIVASLVALFGIAQYFLPHDFLSNVGYSIDRGVKPLFFIDDKPDFPRVMSTLRDPNSLGAYLIVPMLMTVLALFKKGANQAMFWRPFRREVLLGMSIVMGAALFLTFSRGALLALILSLVTTLSIVTGQRMYLFVKKYSLYLVMLIVLFSFFICKIWNTYTFQNLVFHADSSTVLADPNELRVTLTQQAIDEVTETPLGHGPGTAGIVSISNPKGGILTENYYLQIAYEIGWLGIGVFITIMSLLLFKLYKLRNSLPVSIVLFASGIGYAFYSLLIHLWSNEAVALQWWLMTGIVLGAYIHETKRQNL